MLGTLEGSPAARLGVRYGDILLSVNGVRTRTVSDYLEAKDRRPDGMIVTVFRAGEERVVDLAYDGGRRDTLSILSELVEKRVLPAVDDEPTGASS